ncbi:MAG: nucleotidyltransferase family protein [Bryobacteraceae bacterium]
MSCGELPPVVILAGGLATRLRPLTERIPKSLVEIAGHAFLWHQLLLLKSRGIGRVVLCVGYLGEMIRDRFGDGSELGICVDYSFDGPALLGTAGAVRQALPLLPGEFFLLYGDSYLTCDYAEVATVFRGQACRGLMTLYRNEGSYDASNVEYDGSRILRYDKRHRTQAMRHIDYGLGVFQKSVFAGLPAEEPRDLADVYSDLLRKGDLAAFEVKERFFEIGSVEGLRDTAEYLEGVLSRGDTSG